MSLKKIDPVPMCDNTCAIDHSVSYDWLAQLLRRQRGGGLDEPRA